MRFKKREIIKKVVAICVVLFFFAGCAAAPKSIDATYVSPIQYQNYSCDQISQELRRVSKQLSSVTEHQQKESTKDAVAMGVGMILFWPALFFLIGTDKKEELARLKGEYEALEDAAIQRKCSNAEEIKEARKLREEKVKAEETKQRILNNIDEEEY